MSAGHKALLAMKMMWVSIKSSWKLSANRDRKYQHLVNIQQQISNISHGVTSPWFRQFLTCFTTATKEVSFLQKSYLGRIIPIHPERIQFHPGVKQETGNL